MKQRIQLNTKALRHYRESRGMSRTQVGDKALRKSPDQSLDSLMAMYARVERTGKSGTDHAQRLAQFFNVPLDHLLAAPDDSSRWKEGTGWYVSAGENDGVVVGGLIRLYQEFRKCIEVAARVYAAAEIVHADCFFDATQCRVVISISHVAASPRSSVCIIRFVEETDDGLIWRKIPSDLRTEVADALLGRVYEVADQVSMANQPMHPVESSWFFELRDCTIRSLEPTKVHIASRKYRTEKNLVRAILDQYRGISAPRIQLEAHGNAISLSSPDRKQVLTRIHRVYRVDESNLLSAPWPVRRIVALEQVLRSRIQSEISDVSFVKFDAKTKRYVAIPES